MPSWYRKTTPQLSLPASLASLALRMKPLHGERGLCSCGPTSGASTKPRKTRPSLARAGCAKPPRGRWNGLCPCGTREGSCLPFGGISVESVARPAGPGRGRRRDSKTARAPHESGRRRITTAEESRDAHVQRGLAAVRGGPAAGAHRGGYGEWVKADEPPNTPWRVPESETAYGAGRVESQTSCRWTEDSPWQPAGGWVPHSRGFAAAPLGDGWRDAAAIWGPWQAADPPAPDHPWLL